MKAGITISDDVPASRGAEAARLLPKFTLSATIDWPMPADDGDQMMLPDVRIALSAALAACGSVAFRYDELLDKSEIYLPAPRRSIMMRLVDLAGFGKNTFGLVAARDPEAIAAMFDYGWTHAVQAALVFDPAADLTPIFTALRTGLDWRGRPLPDGARLLFGPGHDGDFAVIAASELTWLARFRSALA